MHRGAYADQWLTTFGVELGRLVADAPGNAEAESKEREEAALLALNRRQSGTTNPDAARRPFKREATFSADGRK